MHLTELQLETDTDHVLANERWMISLCFDEDVSSTLILYAPLALLPFRTALSGPFVPLTHFRVPIMKMNS